MSQSRPIDIYAMLVEAEGEKRREERAKILRSMDVTEEYFEEGDVKIDKSTCDGVECKLCIDVCPTYALYWSDGEVKIEKDLCIYCWACVLSCIVDDCIRVTRKREDGSVEKFSKPRDVIMLSKTLASKRRKEATRMKVLARLSSLGL